MELTPSLSDPRTQTLIQHLGIPTPAGGDELRFQSPFQAKFKNPGSVDYKKHLYVNVRKGKFYCHKSGTGGSLSYLFAILGVEFGESHVVLSSIDSLKTRLLALGKAEAFVRPVADLPEWYQPVVAGSEVHRYLTSRRVPDEDIAYYQMGEGSGEFQGWVVIPTFDRTGKCDYWVARNTRKKTYRNPKVDRRFHVAFLDQAVAEGNGHVVVCEGMFSAIAAGRDAVATLGKFVTDHQLRTMFDGGVRKVTLALDGDAWEETLDTAERCLKIGMDVLALPLPLDQDPADLGRARFKTLRDMCSVAVDPLSMVKLKLIA